MNQTKTTINKRTKIVATIGPASNSVEMIEALARAGMNCARLNMSHGLQETHAQVIERVRAVSNKLDKPIAVLVDLQGPKIRLGILPDDGLQLAAGQKIQFVFGNDYQDGGPIPVQYDISKYVKKDQAIYLRDGMIETKIEKVGKGVVTAKVLNNGVVFSKQGINMPDTDLAGDILTDKDLRDAKFGVENKADYIALSFVQSAADIKNLRKRLARLKSKALIIAKIETKAALINVEEIIEASDAIMVARGDLAVEIGPERVPAIQRQLVKLGQRYQKPVIVATQMLESMIHAPQATRAEVSDVASAVAQGADAVMLSAESATGEYPVETVALMKRVILYNEQNISYEPVYTDEFEPTPRIAIAMAAITLARQTKAKMILAETSTGSVARYIASLRSEVPVLGVTDKTVTYNQLALVWGVRSYLIKNPATAHAEVISMLKAEHNASKNDTIVRTSGSVAGVSGTTNTIKIEKIS